MCLKRANLAPRRWAVYVRWPKLCKVMQSLLPVLLLACLWHATAAARTITDMAGRTVTVPDKIEKVYVMSQANMVYTLNPGLLCGLAFPLREDERAMMDPRMRQLPVLGTLNGVGQMANPEVLVAVKPDLVVTSIMRPQDADATTAARVEEILKKTGIPYVYVTARDLDEYPAAYEFLGELLGYEERAKELADYIRAALSDAEAVLAQVPPDKRPKVYYAEQMDGLSTENAESFHTGLLKLAGDVNVHRANSGQPTDIKGYEKILLEDVMAYNPDFILAYEPVFYRQVYQNPGWKLVKAVRNQNVLWIPRGPHNWFDRPPSYMRVLGLKWLLANLYPEYYPIDMVEEARRFYKLFLFYDATAAEMRKIINPFEVNHAN